ncbi:TetR/AcrR family transcriptional regulator [Amphibacillus sp. Q70]|uniref:TetR/AcrR family transcriptional regulator n=1 Tax=Amphibacillus sp. Q70 TaxID=3453416 RepID=UPI003F8385CB
MKDKRMNDTKEKIIEIVVEEIKENGYLTISMRKIAKKYNITGTALYRHFHNKDELLQHALVQVSQDIYLKYQVEIEELSEEKPTVKQKLTRLGEVLLNQSVKDTNLMDFLFFSDYARSSYKEQHNTPFVFLEEYKNLIHQAKEEFNPHIDEGTLFIELWAFIQGYTLLVLNGVAIYDYKLLEQALNKFIKTDKEEIDI